MSFIKIKKYMKKSTSSKDVFLGKDRKNRHSKVECSHALSTSFDLKNIVILIGKIELYLLKYSVSVK